MVRVFRCHHFASQDVFTTENEPFRIYATENYAFIATDQCYIEVHSLTEAGCPMVCKFPTVAPVMELVYSDSGDFIATLEEKPSMSGSQTAVRVYLNWRTDLSTQPMRALIAGHMTSLRHTDGDGTRFEVVEIPLKGNPKCLSVDKTFGAIAIGIGHNVLVYGFCTKVEADTKAQHKDIKCLLDLEFSFDIHHLAIMEDYIAVCSESEVQVVMLKSPTCPGPSFEDCTGKSRAGSLGQANATQEKNNTASSSNHDTPVRELVGFENRSNYTPSPSQTSQSSGASVECGTGGRKADGLIFDDEHFVNWRFDDSEDTIAVPTQQRSTKISSVAAASAHALRTIMLKGIATVQGKKQKAVRLPNNGELLGPVDNPIDCPVSVEYEASHTKRHERASRCCVLCPISDHDSLVGMSVFVSDEDVGFHYSVYGTARHLASYPYTRPAKHVSISDQLLYVATSRGLEVYTCRSVAHALHEVSPVDGITNALPPVDLEPCLIGIQPFIGAEFVQASDRKVLLLTKLVMSSSRTKNPESSWSLYVLRCQKVFDLYKDIMDVAEQHQLSSPNTYLQLLQEGQLLLRTHQFKYGTNVSSIHNLIGDSATLLAEHYAYQETEDGSLTLPYFLISGLTVGNVVKRITSIRRASSLADEFGKGLLVYLDYMLFRQENAIQCSQSEADLILEIYAKVKPSVLSTVILRSTLTCYSNEKALEFLQDWRKGSWRCQDREKLDVLALAVLHMRTGQLHEAEASLLSLTPEELLATCTSNPWLLHEEHSHFSHLSQMLRKHHRKHFIQILISLLEQDIFRLDKTISMLQGNSNKALYENPHIREYLEGILSNGERKQFFADAVRRLIEIYIDSLRNWSPPTSMPSSSVTVRDVIPKGSGHFAKRFAWLDYFPPFQGPRSLTKPCHSLLALRTGQTRDSPQRSAVITEAADTSTSRHACPCCYCNAELLKLQSLLCSSLTPRETLHLLLSELQACPSMRGADSLKVLCLARVDPKAAVALVSVKFPEILPPFVQEMLDSDTDVPMWKHIISLLEEKLVSPSDEVDGQVYEDTFKRVLAHMAEVLPPLELLPLLPEEGSTTLYLPYIERSHEKQRSQKLKTIIIERAKEFELRPS